MNSSITTSISLTGSDAALLLAACFALHLWDFEQPVAQSLVPQNTEAEIERLHDVVSEQVRACFLARIPTKPPGARIELIKARAAVLCAIELSDEQIRLSIVALRACEEEFTDNLTDFYVALPGNLDWYGIGMKEVRALAKKLEQQTRLMDKH